MFKRVSWKTAGIIDRLSQRPLALTENSEPTELSLQDRMSGQFQKRISMSYESDVPFVRWGRCCEVSRDFAFTSQGSCWELFNPVRIGQQWVHQLFSCLLFLLWLLAFSHVLYSLKIAVSFCVCAWCRSNWKWDLVLLKLLCCLFCKRVLFFFVFFSIVSNFNIVKTDTFSACCTAGVTLVFR